MRISDWSSDVCSSDPKKKKNTVSWSFAPPARDLQPPRIALAILPPGIPMMDRLRRYAFCLIRNVYTPRPYRNDRANGQVANWLSSRSEEHTSELQSLIRISYTLFFLHKKTH